MKIENAEDVTAWFSILSHELNRAFVVAGWILSRANWSSGDCIPYNLVRNDVFNVLKHGFLKEKRRRPSGIRDYFFICDELGRYIMDSHDDIQWDTDDPRYTALIEFLKQVHAQACKQVRIDR
jgi:hypothetical protein